MNEFGMTVKNAKWTILEIASVLKIIVVFSESAVVWKMNT